jgi:hypothetical protein
MRCATSDFTTLGWMRGRRRGWRKFCEGEFEEGGFRELWILAIYHQQGGAMRRPGWVRAREMSSWGDQFEAGISVKYGASRW